MLWPNSRAAPQTFLLRRTQRFFVYVELKLSLYTSISNCPSLYTASSNCSCSGELQQFLLRGTPTVLDTAHSNSSCCGELQQFLLRRTPTVLDTANSTFFLLHRTQNVLLNSAASLLNSVSGSFYFAYLIREKSRQWPFHQCILSEEFRYFVLCTLFKNVTVSCIKSLH